MPAFVRHPVTDAANAAADKAEALRALPRYAASTVLAGAYAGLALVLSARLAGGFVAVTVFGVTVTLMALAGVELFTINTMVMALGWLRGHVSPGEAIGVNVVSLVGNIIGAIGFAALINDAGVHTTAPTPDDRLFWRTVACTLLACVAVSMAARATDSAHIVVLFWCVLALVAAAAAPPIANVTAFALAIFQGTAYWSALGDDLLATVPAIALGAAVLAAFPYLEP